MNDDGSSHAAEDKGLPDDINILILGENGERKSMFINTFLNLLYYETLE